MVGLLPTLPKHPRPQDLLKASLLLLPVSGSVQKRRNERNWLEKLQSVPDWAVVM